MSIALNHRGKVIIGAIFLVLLVVGGWFIGISPQLDARALAASQTQTVAIANQQSQDKLAVLAARSESLPELQEQLRKLTDSVPSSSSSSALISQINAIAAQSGVIVDGVKLDQATAYVPNAAPAAVGPETAAPAPETAANPTPDAIATPYVDPRITESNFVLIPVTVNVTGSSDGVLSFLAGIQSGARLFLVNNYSSTRNASSEEFSGEITAESPVSASLSGFVYVLIDSAEPSISTQG